MHNFDLQISSVMERFDFEKTHRVMTFLNWEWANTHKGRAVPTIDEMKSCAYDLLLTVVEEYNKGTIPNGGSAATGGFEARIHVWESKPESVELLFYVDSRASGLDNLYM